MSCRKNIEIKPSSKRWGIVVGVDKYDNACKYLQNLQGCVLDAERMYETMVDENCCGFDKNHVHLLKNPTYKEIEDSFIKIGSRMKKGDELWFYFAGHGYSERRRHGVSGYLLPSDIEFNDDEGTLSTRSCISHEGLRYSFIERHIKCQREITVVLFLDCCCAASVGLCDGSRSARVGSDSISISEGFKESFRDIGMIGAEENGEWDVRYISFMATDKTGKAKEDASGGVFTKCLIEGLKGGRPECPTVGPNARDFYIRAGTLGVFLCNYVPNQSPLQDVKDATYPLSISQERKNRQEQIVRMDACAMGWLTEIIKNGLLSSDAKKFALSVMSDTDLNDFCYSEMLRKLMRLVSTDQILSKDQDVGSSLIKAFCELRSLQNKRDSVSTMVSDEHTIVLASKKGVPSSLTRRDRELLADIERRLIEVGEECGDLCNIARMSQTDAVAALDAMARKYVRRACRIKKYQPLFEGEYDNWSVMARRGFSSDFEAAVYEFVRDDKALAVLRK